MRLSGKAVFVLDSSDRPGAMVNRTAACRVFSITVQGKAAHAGVEPEKGVDAICAASTAIARLELGRIDNETTANIGLISGGAARNVVPDLVSIEGEVRSLSYDKLDKTLADILSSFRALEKTRENISWEIYIKHQKQHCRTLSEESEKRLPIPLS